MEKDKFEKAVNLIKQIKDNKEKLNTIDSLFRSCGLTLKVSGYIGYGICGEVDLPFIKDEIKELLQQSKTNLENEINKLEKEFVLL